VIDVLAVRLPGSRVLLVAAPEFLLRKFGQAAEAWPTAGVVLAVSSRPLGLGSGGVFRVFRDRLRGSLVDSLSHAIIQFIAR
jgi:hypothetical protein